MGLNLKAAQRRVNSVEWGSISQWVAVIVSDMACWVFIGKKKLKWIKLLKLGVVQHCRVVFTIKALFTRDLNANL